MRQYKSSLTRMAGYQGLAGTRLAPGIGVAKRGEKACPLPDRGCLPAIAHSHNIRRTGMAIIGIDLGTAHSAAAVFRGGRPVIIPSAEGISLGGKRFQATSPSPPPASSWRASRRGARQW